MKLLNKTRKTVISDTVTVITSEKERVKGLIGLSRAKTITFETRFGIHTFLMKFSLDVLILSDENMVVSIKENIRPNRIFVWNPRFKKVIELPAGSIKKSRTQLNDMLQYIA